MSQWPHSLSFQLNKKLFPFISLLLTCSLLDKYLSREPELPGVINITFPQPFESRSVNFCQVVQFNLQLEVWVLNSQKASSLNFILYFLSLHCLLVVLWVRDVPLTPVFPYWTWGSQKESCPLPQILMGKLRGR